MESLPVFDTLSLPLLFALFVGAAAVVWFAGIRLSNSTDVLSDNLGFGEALGGLILLAVATNLPEIAITASAALSNQVEIAIGNILGGIAIQTVVLVILDGVGVGKSSALTSRVTNLVPVLEGVLVMVVLIVVVMTAQLPAHLTVARIDPGAVAVAIVWLVGLWLLGKARRGLPWKLTDGAKSMETPDPVAQHAEDAKSENKSTRRAVVVFVFAAVATLVGGVVLEQSGDVISGKIGMSGVLFAATILAAATSLPELSTGLAAVGIGDYQLAVSDIFGGNAFLPALFLESSLFAGTAVLAQAQPSDLYLAGLGGLLTGVYAYGLIARPQRQFWRLGLDSWAVLLLYGAGILGLAAIVSG
jgi:cation:H+ antiporter